jgi:hypothetical protein
VVRSIHIVVVLVALEVVLVPLLVVLVDLQVVPLVVLVALNSQPDQNFLVALSVVLVDQ